MAEPHDAARTAQDRCEWATAYGLLSERVAAGNPAAADLEDLGTAAYLTGREDEAFERWAQAHQVRLADGDPVGAASIGLRLSAALLFKGDIPRASGWAGRARHLLEDAGSDGVEVGHLAVILGMGRIFEEGDIAGAREHFVTASKVADRFGHRELRTMARIGEGRCLIYFGEVAEGLAVLDEAMVAVEAREIPPTSIGDAYCTVIDACAELFDVRRCETWVDSFEAWCAGQPQLVFFRGHYLLHRAELLLLHGRWSEGLALAAEACDRLADPINHLALGGAHYVRGELHRVRGEDERAEAAFAQAHEAGGSPQPGLALLRLAQGRIEVADAAIRRAVGEAAGPFDRVKLLAAFAEVVLAGGDVDGARSAAEEVAAVGAELGSQLLRARGDQLAGAALLATGDAGSALVPLRRAHRGWIDLDAPHEAAATRLLLAEACTALGDHEAATMERAAATAALRAPRADDAAPCCGPDRARGRGARAAREGRVQPGHRRRALHQREDRGQPCGPHLHEGRRLVSRRGDGVRLRARARAPVTSRAR